MVELKGIELQAAIISVIRNPENSDNLVSVVVRLPLSTIESVETMAICWKNGDEITPMAVIVTPELAHHLIPKLENTHDTG